MAASGNSPADVKAVVLDLDRRFMANAKAGDAVRLVEDFYAEDASVLPPHHETVRGRAAIIQMWRGVLAGGLKDLTLTTTEIESHGDMAYGMGQFHMVVEPPGGARSEQTGKYLVVYRRQSGEWKAVADMFSPNS